MIRENMVFEWVGEDASLSGLHRLLQICEKDDPPFVIVIPIPFSASSNKQGRTRFFAKGCRRFSLAALREADFNNQIVERQLALPPVWLMSDADIERRYPSKRHRNTQGSHRCYMLAKRDAMYFIVLEILGAPGDTPAYLDELTERARLLAKKNGRCDVTYITALHRFLAFGRLRSALLPYTSKCGAPTKSRLPRNGIKAGRKNAQTKDSSDTNMSYVCDENDRENLRDGWAYFLRPGATVRQAYLKTMQTWYTEETNTDSGEVVHRLKDAKRRPTESEFRYHGPKTDELAAFRRLMGELDFAKTMRPQTGSARDGVVAAGQLASIDASPIDVHLCALTNPLQSIGVGRGIFVTDVDTGLYFGAQQVVGAPKTEDVLLALYRGAQPKDELLRRFGLDLDPEEFPSGLHLQCRVDNGELRSKLGMDTLVKELRGTIEFIPSGRADLNSIAETGHHARHKRLDHHLKGTTYGRQRKRGEKAPATQAVLDYPGYMRLLLRYIHWLNNGQEVPEQVSVEMRRDNVKSRRMAIYKWKRENGYDVTQHFDMAYLRSRLLPTFRASVGRNGIHVHAPTDNGKIELLPQARYNSTWLASSGMIARAISGGVFHIDIKADPEDLSKVFYFDEHGCHELENTSNDVLLLTQGTVADLIAMKHSDCVDHLKTASSRDQNELDFATAIDSEIAAGKQRQRQRAAQQSSKGNVLKVSATGIREAAKTEQRDRLVEAIPAAIQTESPSRPLEPPKTTSAEMDGTSPPLRETSLAAFRQRRKGAA